ncbi:hypothetical protein [Streptococcus sp. CSL10205-OR2]|uniref:hypothetical protein n=1 Tax=Streptococcus sp. CSL10205-OR2 TaxID=2980558 RepID=UPI0021DB6358|nr:hypothetical protein [Streptococcus sp. CSL10205-OR2]MCU9533699.1 hypothetical protein [Streptococcus sp. CSL10205-OR2]
MIDFNNMLVILLPVLIGALIPIVPNIIYKFMDNRSERIKNNRNLKLNNYVELINLITFVLKNPNLENGRHNLMAIINLVNLVGSPDVVKSLNEYIKTWGKDDNQEEQNKSYNKLLSSMRKDLGIDVGILPNLPVEGLIEVNIRQENSDFNKP